MIKLHSPKHYSLVVGVLLFVLGFFGFVSRSFELADRYLILFLILGVWGIVVATKKQS